MIYFQEHEYDVYDASDPTTYQKAIHCPQFTYWKEAMDDEMNSMYMNGVWNLVELPHGCKPVGCKWVLRPNVILVGKQRDIKLDLWLKVIVKEKELILKKHSHLYRPMTLLE